MGFLVVAVNLRSILRNISNCKKDIAAYVPDIVILVDYPGFNLRIARFAKNAGFKVCYYISPQVWAWKESRVEKIKKYVDKMYVILPFEKKFYANLGYEVEYVGHPLLDIIDKNESSDFRQDHQLTEEKIIAILPGSRKHEINAMLPTMMKMKESFPAYQYVIAGAPGVEEDYYNTFENSSSFKLVFDQTHDLLRESHCAMVTSGTASLETALFMIPEVVCYKGNEISYQIAKWLINVDYICLVNLILDKPVVVELIQDEFNERNLRKSLGALLEDEEVRNNILKEYTHLNDLLTETGASQKVATQIDKFIKAD